MSVLFPKIPALLHGGDYNPDQWLDRPDILEEDIKMMKKGRSKHGNSRCIFLVCT